MNAFFNYLLTALVFANAIFADANIQSSNVACDINAISSNPGFVGSVYQFTQTETQYYSNPSFYAEGYKTEGSFVSAASNIASIDFSLPGGSQTLYGVPVDSSNFAVEYTGYFYAPTDGIYEFDLTRVDDGAIVFVGAGAYDCCHPGSIPSGIADTAALFAYKPWNQAGSTNAAWIYFEGGSYYPIRIVYANFVSAGGIALSVKAPGGSSSQNIGSFVYQLVNNPANICAPKTISTQLASSTTFYYSQGTAGTTTIPYTFTTGGITTVVVEEVIYFSTIANTQTNYVSGSSYYTSSYLTTFVTGGQTSLFEVINIGVPILSTTTTYANVKVTSTLTSFVTQTVSGITVVSSVILIEEPNLQYTYHVSDVTQVTTTTSAYTTIISGKTAFTSEIVVIGPALSTVTSFMDLGTLTTFVVTSVTTISGVPTTARYYQVNDPRSVSTTTWNIASRSSTIVTATIVTNGTTKVVQTVINYVPSISYSYSSGTGTVASTITQARTITVNGITSEYLEVDIIHRTPFTSIAVGTVETTYLTTYSGKTYEVIQETNFPTTSVFSTNKNFISTYTYVFDGTSTQWMWEYIYPQPTTIANQWTGLYTLTSTVTMTNAQSIVTGFSVVEYVPSYSQSVSFWTGSGITTVYSTGAFTNRFGVVSVSTYEIVYRPSVLESTTTWRRPETSKYFTPVTLTGDDGFPITTTEVVIEVPGTDVVYSWTTSDIYGACTTSTTTISYMETVIHGQTTTIGVDIVSGPAPSCYAPPPTTVSTTKTIVASDCGSHTVTSTTRITASNYAITESVIVIIETPDLSCTGSDIATTTVPATDCVLNTVTTSAFITASNNKVTTIVSIIVSTPAPTCNSSSVDGNNKMISTSTISITSTIPGTDCALTTVTTTSTITGTSGAIISIDVIVKTPPTTCTVSITATSIVPATDCVLTTVTDSVVITASDYKVTKVVSIIVSSPALACASAATITTTVPATDCVLNTVTTSAFITASNNKVTTIVSIIVSTPAPTCNSSSVDGNNKMISTSTISITSTIPGTDCALTTVTTTSTITGTSGAIISIDVIVKTPATTCPSSNIVTNTVPATDCQLITETTVATIINNDTTTAETYVVVKTPAPSCTPSTTSSYEMATDCSFSASTTTAIFTSSDAILTNVIEIFYTPAPSCDVFITTEIAPDCLSSTYTTYVATVNSEGKYVNATLIVIETPGLTCLPTGSSSSSLLPHVFATTTSILPSGATNDSPAITDPSSKTNPSAATKLSSTIDTAATTAVNTASWGTLVTVTCTEDKCSTTNAQGITNTITDSINVTQTTCANGECQGELITATPTSPGSNATAVVQQPPRSTTPSTTSPSVTVYQGSANEDPRGAKILAIYFILSFAFVMQL